MGLAASQARFLCITARKMNCEYKSTDLAQQKLEITNQLADISNTYSNALSSTKLMWDNDAVSSASSLNFNLLMSPSAANDYNPYMLSTTTGAIVLNSEYAAAAKAAGISKSGGFGSQESRDKFISALAYTGRITEDTANSVAQNLYKVEKDEDGNLQFVGKIAKPSGVTSGIVWNPLAGMGGVPKDKYAGDDFTMSQLCMSDIGKTKIDWAQALAGVGQITEQEYDAQIDTFTSLIKSTNRHEITKEVLGQLNSDYSTEESKNGNPDASPAYDAAKAAQYKEVAELAKYINNTDEEGYITNDSGVRLQLGGQDVKQNEAYTAISKQLAADKDAYKAKYEKSTDKVSIDNVGTVNSKTVGINTEKTNLNDKQKHGDATADKNLFILSNGIVQTGDAVSEIDIADILTGNISIISGKGQLNETEFKEITQKIFDNIVKQFGYVDGSNVSGVGLNIDDTSAKALSFAYNMVQKQFFKSSSQNVGSNADQKSMMDNAAYVNSEKYNSVGTNKDNTNYAVSLSNMLSAFLTYYDNGLNGVDSNYVVGSSVETSEYVTEDAGYVYLGKLDEENYTMSEKVADFYDIIYNNIIEHGWREDVSLDDSEYMEQCIKNGIYSMVSLNDLDGYYYQTRYNETGYMTEVSDDDAIARAEAEFTAKKAELTYKEDKIDIQTKQLDAEISSLTTEYETVKQLISKSIEKTFTMFSN